MDRITERMLNFQVQTLNTRKGYIAEPPYNMVGSYHLDYAYGGVQLNQVVNDSGGVRVVSNTGYGTKRQLYTFMAGMLSANHEF